METSQLTSAGWIILAGSAALAVAGLLWVSLVPSDGRTARWSSHHGLALTASNGPVVAAYLRRTSSLQIAGTAVGWLSSPLYVAVVGRPFPLGDSWVLLGVAGYLVGAVVAEVTVLRPRRTSRIRAALLVSRTLSDYIPAATLWTMRALPTAMVLLAVIYGLAPKNPERTLDPSIAFMAAASVVLVALVALIDWFLRTIVSRPQPAITDDLLAADDVIRAGSIHALSAAVVALILLSTGWALASLGDVTASAQLGELLPWVAVACDLGAVIAWVWLAHLASWQVRRVTGVANG